MARKKALVAGVSGLIGRAVAEHFAASPGWDVVGLSRRRPQGLAGVDLRQADLLDPADVERVVAEAGEGVTHLVFAALYEPPGLGSHLPGAREKNVAMLANLFEPLARIAPSLEHVSLLHGTKAYGIHFRKHWDTRRIPLRESDPRVEHENFYFGQEAYLRERQAGARWRLTMFRPTVVYGDALGVNMNPLPPLLAYAAILRAKGEPLHFPGRATEPWIQEAVDAGLLARAIAWAGEAPETDGQAYNVTNGDVFLWRNVWPSIADELGMEVGEDRPLELASELPARAEDWAEIVARHALLAPSDVVEFAGANSLLYVDRLLSGMGRPPVPFLNSTIKIRQAGFHECLDTEQMLRLLIRRFREQRLVPERG